jgi:hypothetical protein
MEQFNPLSDLDRAIVAAHRSPSALPELCRQLCQGELFLLIPHHPEFGQDDQLELRNGMEVPFVIQPEGEGEVVLIFSSEERAQEGMRRGKVPPGTYRIVSMSAIQALEVLGKVGLRALVNKCCAMPQLILPPELMRDIASGKVFQSSDVTSREMEEITLRLLDPADYPTDLIQPVFEILRKHRQFRAAWIFTYPPAATDSPARLCYHFILSWTRSTTPFTTSSTSWWPLPTGRTLRFTIAPSTRTIRLCREILSARPSFLCRGRFRLLDRELESGISHHSPRQWPVRTFLAQTCHMRSAQGGNF